MNHLATSLVIGTWPAAAVACRAVDGTETINGLYHLEVEVESSTAPQQFSSIVGEASRLTWTAGERKRMFHGIVSSVGTRARLTGTDTWTYALHLEPRAWLATRNRTSRVFENRRADNIISTVLALYHIPVRWELRGPLPIREYTTQYEESDWQFIQRLAADNGLSLFLEQPDAELDDLFAMPRPDRAAEIAVNATNGLGTAPPEALLNPIAASGPVREVVVFTDGPHGYLPCGRPRPWNIAVRSMSDALGAAAAQGASLEAVTGAEGARLPSAVQQRLSDGARRVGDVVDGILGSDAVLTFRPHSGALLHPDDRSVLRFEDRSVITAQSAHYRHYDPERPNSRLQADARDRQIERSITRALRGDLDPAEAMELGLNAGAVVAREVAGAVTKARGLHHVDRPLEVYAHHGRQPDPDRSHDGGEARRMLHRALRDGRTVEADSTCPWLSTGHRFRLEGHFVENLNAEWTVVAIRHRLSSPTDRDPSKYTNVFECVPAHTLYPVAPSTRRFVHAVQTAVVVGGGDISTNRRAQVRVKFDWDRNEHNSCWLRVMQPWAGAAWGAQFIPRVGTEVVVAYEGGDPDLPIVLGGVYNGTNPPPFNLPVDQTRSGFRTRTSPGADGSKYSELSFDDAAEAERIRMRAQRDLDVDVLNDRTVHIGRDDRVAVDGSRQLSVTGRCHETHQAERVVEVRGTQRSHVGGNRVESTSGGSTQRFERGREVTVEGDQRIEVQGAASSTAHGNVIRRVGRSQAEVVGSAEHPGTDTVHVHGDLRRSASEVVELRADSMLVLRCGGSQIRMTNEGIEINAPEVVITGGDARVRAGDGSVFLTAPDLIQGLAEQVVMAGDGAAISITSEIAADGSQILLNSPAQASDPASPSVDEPTFIELVDQHNQPIPHHPYRIILDSGGERSGVLDAHGCAELDLEEGGEVVFPGFNELERQ